MRVAVVGAGTIGLTTAYFLHEAGAQVSVFEAVDSVAAGASFANGGQLSYSFADGMATPSMLRKLPRILFAQDPAIRARISWSPSFLRWGFDFLRACLPGPSAASSRTLLQLALASEQLLAPLHSELGEHYHYRRTGKLVLLGQPADENLCNQVADKQAAGCAIELLSRAQAQTLEPAIATLDTQPAGAIYGESDAVGDARGYACQLAKSLTTRGVRIRLNTPVLNLVQNGKRITGLIPDNGVAEPFDAVVCCAGGATDLLRSVGAGARIQPVTGYSLTLPAGDVPLDKSLTLLDDKIVFSRLGTKIRIAGMADINWPEERYEERLLQLLAIARTRAPLLARYPSEESVRLAASGKHNPECEVWVGHRPMTANGLPLTGATSRPGLFLNMGHGMLGWTLAGATSASVAACVMSSFSTDA